MAKSPAPPFAQVLICGFRKPFAEAGWERWQGEMWALEEQGIASDRIAVIRQAAGSARARNKELCSHDGRGTASQVKMPQHMNSVAPHRDPTQPRTWTKPHYAGLNGLRGIAIALVFACHYGGTLLPITHQTLWVGVDLFFVLSGFLITGILYDTLESPHYFRDFYTRRALRIFPVFYGLFLCIFLATPLLHLHWHANLLVFPAYLGNIVTPLTDLQRHNPTKIWVIRKGIAVEAMNIGVLWSLCVEEQFYLVWPAVVLWIRNRKKLMNLCAVASLLILIERIVLRFSLHLRYMDYFMYWSTYTRCDTLLAGAWLALYLRGKQLSQMQLRRAATLLFWIPVILFVLGVRHWRGVGPVAGMLTSPFTETVGYSLLALAAMGFLLRALDEHGWIARILEFKPLAGLGLVSYGFYIYHGILEDAWYHMAGVHPKLVNVVPFVAFGTTLLISWLSYRFYETPFLRLKKVLAPQRQRPGSKQDGIALGFHVSEPRP